MLACRRVIWRPTLAEAPSLNDALRQDRCESPHERKGIDKDRWITPMLLHTTCESSIFSGFCKLLIFWFAQISWGFHWHLNMIRYVSSQNLTGVSFIQTSSSRIKKTNLLQEQRFKDCPSEFHHHNVLQQFSDGFPFNLPRFFSKVFPTPRHFPIASPIVSVSWVFKGPGMCNFFCATVQCN